MNKIILLLILILGQSLNAQISSLTEDELKAKIQLDTKVEISKSYMKVSGYTTLISIGVTIGAPNLTLMKKLFFLLSIFAIVLSCSSDETSTPVTPPPAPIVKYTITLSAGEGGTVSTTGGEYEAGQTVSVTATPQGEYVFTSWSDGNTNATRTITLAQTQH